jgi:hypothetical protein
LVLGIHPAVDDWVVHGVGHRQPVDAQVKLMNVHEKCTMYDVTLISCIYHEVMKQMWNGSQHTAKIATTTIIIFTIC